MTNNAILCVDDEWIILMSLKIELEERFNGKYILETAKDAFEALNTIEALVKDGINIILIITDWLMPKMKGDEFLLKVKEKYPNIKFIVISGQMDDNAIKKVQSEATPLAIIKKPWNPDELFAIIEKAVSE